MSKFLDTTAYSTNITSIYKKAFIAILTKIKHGCIHLQDPDGNYTFGNHEDEMRADLVINTNAVYKLLFWNGSVGLANSYIEGLWSTNNLTLLLRIFSRNLELVNSADSSVRGLLFRFLANAAHYLNKNNISGSKSNISEHYDLGNDFFKLFLDPTMMYSSAIYAQPEQSLAEASINKLRIICEKLQLQPSDHVLEIGSGWGGFACFAAQNYACKITTTTISQEQYDHVIAKVRALGLESQVTVLKQDYRQLQGCYDKLVSIEMIEAVGHHYFKSYFQQCAKLVKNDGLFLLQAITIRDQNYESARDSVDFIKMQIFPGCCIPSVSEIMLNIKKHTNYNLLNLQDITLDYARTLRAWRLEFIKHLAEIELQGFDKRFVRKWLYYFCYCEAGFLERLTLDVQMLFAKPEYRLTEYAAY